MVLINGHKAYVVWTKIHCKLHRLYVKDVNDVTHPVVKSCFDALNISIWGVSVWFFCFVFTSCQPIIGQWLAKCMHRLYVCIVLNTDTF